MRKIVSLFFLFCLLGGVFLGTSDAAVNAKNPKYNKNYFPAGWQYEPSYTVWRMQKGLSANRVTYRRYRKDKARQTEMQKYHKPEELLLNTLDWTTAEVAKFWETYEEYLKFHPAGVE